MFLINKKLKIFFNMFRVIIILIFLKKLLDKKIWTKPLTEQILVNVLPGALYDFVSGGKIKKNRKQISKYSKSRKLNRTR